MSLQSFGLVKKFFTMASVIHSRPPKQPATPKWKNVWFKFSQDTTLHGVKNVTGETPFLTRRILWVLLVVAGFILFGYQALERILYYRSYPVTVNLKINHNKSIRFPALTICNQNRFRMTKTYERGHYYFLDEMFRIKNLQTFNATQWGVGELKLDDIYAATHQKDDMIISCYWGGKLCSADDFEVVATDYGMCISFNKNHLHPYKVSRTGVDEGLRLMLNVERYEYMARPDGATGLRILIHDQNEVPYVQDLGSAIPIGASAFVGVKMVQIHNLPPPYGKCSKMQQLQYYDGSYSLSACMRECKTDFVQQYCGCRDIYMPGKS